MLYCVFKLYIDDLEMRHKICSWCTGSINSEAVSFELPVYGRKCGDIFWLEKNYYWVYIYTYIIDIYSFIDELN